MNIENDLKDFGLKEAEIKLYLAGLRTGEAPLSRIAKVAGIKRGSAYLVAKELEKKGLMGSYKMKDGLRFAVVRPATLADQAERRAEAIYKIIPELNAIRKGSEERPGITVYEGKEGYLTLFEDSINTHGGTIRAIGSLSKFYEIITYKYDNEHYIPERVKRNIRFKGLYTEKTEIIGKFPKERDRRELREMRFIPEKYQQPTFTLIYRDIVVVFSSKKELIAVKIESEDIAKSEKARFDLIWDLVGEE